MKISTVNVNGIRAAARKGLSAWLEAEDPDVVLMQEVRAEAGIAADLLGEDWASVVVPCRIKGRAGVLVAARTGRVRVLETREVLDGAETDADSGRWVEALVEAEGQARAGRLRLFPFRREGHAEAGREDGPFAEDRRSAR